MQMYGTPTSAERAAGAGVVVSCWVVRSEAGGRVEEPWDGQDAYDRHPDPGESTECGERSGTRDVTLSRVMSRFSSDKGDP